MKIHELLADPARWTKGAPARNNNQDIVMPCSDFAVSWCLVGASSCCYGEHSVERHFALLAIAGVIGKLYGINEGIDLGHFNDTHTHAEVLAVALAADV